MLISRELFTESTDFLRHLFQFFGTSKNQIINNSPHVNTHANNDLFLAARPTELSAGCRQNTLWAF